MFVVGGKKASAKLRQNVVKYEQWKRRILWLLNDLAQLFSSEGVGGAMGNSKSIDSLSIVSATDSLLK